MKILDTSCYLIGPEATENTGHHLAKKLEPGTIVTLQGDLGAGKTTFAKGLIASYTNALSEEIVSPTFTYLNVYSGGLVPLYHFDLYRLKSAEQFLGMGFEEFLEGPLICVIEWPEHIASILPTHLSIIIDHLDETSRMLTLKWKKVGL